MIYLPAVLVTAGIAILSLAESSHMPSVSLNDKHAHSIMYCVLTLTWLLPLLRTYPRVRTYLYVCVGATMYGALMEILQRFCTLTRSGEMADLLADFIGVLIGIVLVALVKSIINHQS